MNDVDVQNARRPSLPTSPVVPASLRSPRPPRRPTVSPLSSPLPRSLPRMSSPHSPSSTSPQAMMKRLMSKPAPPYSGSESEGRSKDPSKRKRFDSATGLDTDTGMDTDGQLEVLDQHIASLGLSPSKTDDDTDNDVSTVPLSPLSAAMSPSSANTRPSAQRNVLRRKTSAPITKAPQGPRQPATPSNSRRLPITIPTQNPRPSTAPSPIPKPLNHNSDTYLRPIRQRERSHTASPASSRGHSPASDLSREKDKPKLKSLTPAGALVEAYKRQEQVRTISHSAPVDSPLSTTIMEFGSPEIAPNQTHKHTRGRPPDLTKPQPPIPFPGEGDSSGIPYYTVFGSTSGHVVAVGSPQDTWTIPTQWDSSVMGLTSIVTATGKEREKERSPSFGRTITRKVSGKWKRVTNSPNSSSLEEEEHGVSRGRPSLQEKPGRNLRNLRLSLDRFTAEERRAIDAQGELTAGKLVKSRRTESGSTGSGAGHKIWKIVKRISTGGLRDKYHDAEEPPPVPALPKDYLTLNMTRSIDSQSQSQDHSNVTSPTQGGSVLSRLIPVRSTSGPASLAPLTRTTSAGATTPASHAQPPANVNNPRPSTTTRSSSPVSSDVASSRFFNRTQSTRSSTSSYGEEVPPVPRPALAQHIIPPSELYKIQIQHDVSMAASTTAAKKPTASMSISTSTSSNNLQPPSETDWMIARSPIAEFPSLPFPPRRPFALRPKEEFEPESPTIPSFSTLDAINTFTPKRKTSTSSFSRSSTQSSPNPLLNSPTVARPASALPPPRPSRSAQRPQTDSAVNNTRRVMSPDRNTESHAIPVSRTSMVTTSSSSSTVRGRRSISRLSEAGEVTSPSSKIQFRELGQGTTHVLTEEEKAEKWDDLLDRSARAGGTLHLGAGDRLLSDQIRFSVVSEIG